MKKMILSAVIMIAAFGASAQNNKALSFSVGAEVGAVTGNLGDFYSVALGATAQIDYKLVSNFAVTANSGFITFTGKKISGTNLKYQSQTLIPLLIGGKYYFENSKAYGALQLGSSFSTRSGGGSSFTYVPGIGYKFNDRVDAVLKYTGYSGDGGTFGVRLAYTF